MFTFDNIHHLSILKTKAIGLKLNQGKVVSSVKIEYLNITDVLIQDSGILFKINRY